MKALLLLAALSQPPQITVDPAPPEVDAVIIHVFERPVRVSTEVAMFRNGFE
jgi:hypothetical protein